MDTPRFVELLEDCDLDVTTSYTWSGMSGGPCVGFTVDEERAVTAAIVGLMTWCARDEREELGEILRGGRLDRVGSALTFCFPSVESSGLAEAEVA